MLWSYDSLSEYREPTVPLQDYIMNIDSLKVKACSDHMTASQSTGKWLYHYKITSWIQTTPSEDLGTKLHTNASMSTLASLSPHSPVHKLSIWFVDCLQCGKPGDKTRYVFKTNFWVNVSICLTAGCHLALCCLMVVNQPYFLSGKVGWLVV